MDVNEMTRTINREIAAAITKAVRPLKERLDAQDIELSRLRERVDMLSAERPAEQQS